MMFRSVESSKSGSCNPLPWGYGLVRNGWNETKGEGCSS